MNTTAAHAAALTKLAADLHTHATTLTTGDIIASDPRLTNLWQTTGEMATEEDMCSVYDEVISEVGGTGRRRDYAIDIDVTISATIQITAHYEARDPDDAITITHDYLDNADIRRILGSTHNTGELDYEIEEWEAVDAHEA